MLVILILILVLIGAAVVGSIYSNFLVFHSNFSETENYHKAYYASISALERAELVTKQRQPGYVGSGGIIMGTGQGSIADGGSDGGLSGFSYYEYDKDNISVFWKINSRTTRIPATGNGDVEWMLSYKESGDPSKNSDYYNMMDYENAEVFLLYYDEGDENPYKKKLDVKLSRPQKVEGEIRLPKLLEIRFGKLNTGKSLVGDESRLPKDDSIVDWQIRGQSNGNPFTIYSTESVDGDGADPQVRGWYDSVFRESDINNVLRFKFFTSRSPIKSSSRGISLSELTVIGQDENNIKNMSFKDIFQSAINLQLRFSLLNLLQGSGENIYPFLEYYVDFGEATVPDKYFNIDAKGEYKDFNVDMNIQKPTVKETIFGSFTSIF